MIPEDMKGNFSADIGNINNGSDNKKIYDKLEEIIEKLDSIDKKMTPSVTKMEEETPVLEEPKVEAIDNMVEKNKEVSEDISFSEELDKVVSDLNAKKNADIDPDKLEDNTLTTQDFSNEIDQILKEIEKKEEIKEEKPFTPVNVDTIPNTEEEKEENGFVDIDTLLKEVPAQKVETPVVSESPVQPEAVEQPITPVIETPVSVEPEIVIPKKNYINVTEDYIGMTIPGNEVKTEGQHRTLLVTDNEKFKQVKQAEKALVMGNVA